MEIYKWRCPYCDTVMIEPSGTSESQARWDKDRHVTCCKYLKEHKNLPPQPQYLHDRDIICEVWL
jgi:hypothetical protein